MAGRCEGTRGKGGASASFDQPLGRPVPPPGTAAWPCRAGRSIRGPMMRSPFPRWAALTLFAAAAAWLPGCDEDEAKPAATTEPSQGDTAGPRPLTAEERRQVLAKVGPRTITLGEFAETLERMDPFERVRYQSAERRSQLLDEMIEVELLAQEAERRGLDKRPETRLRLQQIVRDEMLERLRSQMPDPSALPERDVRAYYDQHRDEFREPERRRVLHISVGTEALARKVAEEAQGATGEKWAELAKRHSMDRRGTEAAGAPELAGDLGLVSAPGEPRGDNPLVPEALRKAVFQLEKLGDVTSEPLFAEGVYHVVRLGGVSSAKDRSYAEAERMARLELQRKKLLEREAELERQLRERFEVKVDEGAVRALEPKAP